MATFKGRGVILKESGIGESDKILTLLLKDLGKISVSARGAKKPKSKFLAGTQLFTYADFIIFNGGKFFSITQIDVIENFYALRNDFERLCYAHYFVELCEKTILENLPCDDILLLLLKSLSHLSKGRIPVLLIAAAFECKYLQFYGYAPEPEDLKISSAAHAALSYIMEAGLNELFQFRASPQIIEEIRMVSDFFIKTHLDVRIKSLDLL